MNGRTLVVGILGSLVLVLGAIFWLGATSGGRSAEDGEGASAVGWKKDPSPASKGGAAPDADGGAR